MKGGVRGKYVERYREGTNVVLLDPDVAHAFPDAKAVNDALRLLLREKGARSLQNRSGAESPRGQPAWGGGCDRIVKSTLDLYDPVATA